MSLQPLLAAPPLYQFHAFLACAAFLLGIVQFAMPKGTLPHRTLGYLWVAIMATVALSSFGIRSLAHGRFSFVHIVAVATLLLLPVGVMHARRHNAIRHGWAMIGLFAGTLVIAGAFTLVPGRIMHSVVFGAG